MRGEFRFADGLVVSNNITTAGHAMILRAAFQNHDPAFNVALVVGEFDPTLTLAGLAEVVGNGYARKPLNRDTTDWTMGVLNAEQFVESKDMVWTATGNYSLAFSRMALLNQADNTVYALSGALPTPRLITPTTPVEQRTLRYRVYLGQ